MPSNPTATSLYSPRFGSYRRERREGDGSARECFLSDSEVSRRYLGLLSLRITLILLSSRYREAAWTGRMSATFSRRALPSSISIFWGWISFPPNFYLICWQQSSTYLCFSAEDGYSAMQKLIRASEGRLCDRRRNCGCAWAFAFAFSLLSSRQYQSNTSAEQGNYARFLGDCERAFGKKSVGSSLEFWLTFAVL